MSNQGQIELSILCVTKAESCILPLLHRLESSAIDLSAEFVLVADGEQAHYDLTHGGFGGLDKGSNIPIVYSKGYIESILDEAISYCNGQYILRIDDDESISPSMFNWLLNGYYVLHDHWKFARAHLWQDEQHYITSLPLWQDHQTRLSIKSKSGSRYGIHAGSPYGGGTLAPAPIYHHKFLVKSREERQAIVDRYESLQSGAGSNFIVFSLPETLGDLDIKLIDDMVI